MEVVGVRVEMPSNQPIVLLKEINGSRFLPIWVGTGEATAIAFAQQGLEPARPLTHDLLSNTLDLLEATLTAVHITDLVDGVFFATLLIRDRSSQALTLDARPSDAIAIGLRFDATIYTYETILAEAGIVLTDQEEEDDKEKAQPKETKPKAKKETVKKGSDDYKNYSMDKLKDLLKDALDKEDYEKAAKIRDELGKRN